MSYDFTTCSDCGAIVPLERAAGHECEHDKWVAYQVGRLHLEVEQIDLELSSYLQTSRGQFEAWYAQRTRRHAA